MSGHPLNSPPLGGRLPDPGIRPLPCPSPWASPRFRSPGSPVPVPRSRFPGPGSPQDSSNPVPAFAFLPPPVDSRFRRCVPRRTATIRRIGSLEPGQVRKEAALRVPSDVFGLSWPSSRTCAARWMLAALCRPLRSHPCVDLPRGVLVGFAATSPQRAVLHVSLLKRRQGREGLEVSDEGGESGDNRFDVAQQRDDAGKNDMPITGDRDDARVVGTNSVLETLAVLIDGG